MATGTLLLEAFSTITDSLTSAIDGLPSTESFVPPSEGLSLLDTKNELLFSYLQNLVLLILYKICNHRISPEVSGQDAGPSHEDIVKNLVTLRLYLEKGVRPLESRLKYQLDKLLPPLSFLLTLRRQPYQPQLLILVPLPLLLRIPTPQTPTSADRGLRHRCSRQLFPHKGVEHIVFAFAVNVFGGAIGGGQGGRRDTGWAVYVGVAF